jgi:vacuolar-type H+-ATPase subunit E/Vma4
MPIQEIEKRILEEAQAQALKINQETEKKVAQIEAAGLRKMEETKAKILEEARSKAEEVKRHHLVPARLKARKEILEEKQKFLSDLYNEIQREKKLSSAEIAGIREESEVKASMILFAK